MTAVTTSAERSESRTRDLISVAEFRGWLARAAPCSWFVYHRGLLIWDRSPASGLTETDRRALAKIANAVFQAAEQGEVHLAQRRNGPFVACRLPLIGPFVIEQRRSVTGLRERQACLTTASSQPCLLGDERHPLSV